VITGDMIVKTHPFRHIDAQKTKERISLLAVTVVFLAIFGVMFVFLFLDMMKQF
jgi:hypothetical protein